MNGNIEHLIGAVAIFFIGFILGAIAQKRT